MTEPLTGMRGTKYADATEGSIPRDVAERINLLEPDAAPLVVLSSSMKRKQVAKAAKFEWFEDRLAQNTTTCSGAAGTGTTINVTTGQGTRIRVGDILIAQNGESILVTTVATDALTVERSKGATAAYSLADGDQLVVVGNAMAEGSAVPTFKYTKKTNVVNYIQIFRDPIELTDVQSVVDSYGGNDRTYQRMKIGIEHRRSIEHAFLFGDGFEDTSGSQTRRGTKGLINWITTNVTDFGDVLTQADFETWLRGVFRYGNSMGGRQRTLLCSPIWISAINFWANQSLNLEPNDKVYGLSMASYLTGHGKVNLVNHWLLQDFTEFSQYAFAIDPMNIRYRYLPGLDTKLHVDTQAKSDAKIIDEYRSYVGEELQQEQTHGIGKGVIGFA